MSAEETFLQWEPGHQFVYALTGAPLPGLRTLIESYRVEDLGPERSRLTWQVAVTPFGLGRLRLRWLSPLLRIALRRAMVPWRRRGLEKLVRSQA